MRRAEVRVDDRRAGELHEGAGTYTFTYDASYDGSPVSLTMPVSDEPYRLDRFPPFFDGLLPEGAQLEALLRQAKLDRSDLFGQLVTVGQDLVGNVTVYPIKEAGAIADAGDSAASDEEA
ncbi:MAG: HipA N-terminal domain-containing protein [Rhodothermales bacterium]